MIEKSEYICEVCEATYKDKEKALLCEKFHQMDGEVITQFMRPKNMYPSRLLVEYKDGKKIWYTMLRDSDQKFTWDKEEFLK